MVEETKVFYRSFRQISLWIKAAVILPIVALAGIFFIWVFDFTSLYSQLMVIGFTATFGIAVIWWWWAMWTISQILKYNQEILTNFRLTVSSIKELRDLVHYTFHESDK